MNTCHDSIQAVFWPIASKEASFGHFQISRSSLAQQPPAHFLTPHGSSEWLFLFINKNLKVTVTRLLKGLHGLLTHNLVTEGVFNFSASWPSSVFWVSFCGGDSLISRRTLNRAQFGLVFATRMCIQWRNNCFDPPSTLSIWTGTSDR